MTQRLVAIFVALPLTLALFAAALFVPLPYATYMPGPTINVLGEVNGSETVSVRGAKTYRDDGELRMTTVSVSPVGDRLSLVGLMRAWFDPHDAVYPYDFVHPKDVSAEQDQQQGAVDMVTSQDLAIANALTALGYQVKPTLQVAYVDPDTPADGALKVRDTLLELNGQKITGAQMLVKGIRATPAGDSITLTILRNGKKRTVTVKPKDSDGVPRVGFTPGRGFTYPFQVAVNIDPNIGGPSAGLMFALAIYDTLTPGSLTGGGDVAGTGTIDVNGKVGPIGGIQQKIAGAEADGVQLFLVPPDDCKEALEVDDGSPRLVKAPTFESALESVQTWADDHDATLPSCGDGSRTTAGAAS
ncbi:YlbL family protein [Nocardioides acrostichi]|uniref:endopeptidase La n=1 Tax=Nocardioides acrostichi TaxID=2784339 RepID=A0A930UX56_9ACTN|nr:PDZ domain-containing protein [Nocardioides acrostichi]MBF4160705.1 PDZ domain-containing protein [Nocardioides acrostichi]